MEQLKAEHFERNSGGFVLPDLNIDVDLFNKCCWLFEINVPLLTDFPPNNHELNEIETNFSGIYFDRLTNALQILNEMIDLHDEGETVGMELGTADNSVDIFHDAFDPQWVNAK